MPVSSAILSLIVAAISDALTSIVCVLPSGVSTVWVPSPLQNHPYEMYLCPDEDRNRALIVSLKQGNGRIFHVANAESTIFEP
jgi:tetrahydromethanopterin S-methyltransferase subunit C